MYNTAHWFQDSFKSSSRDRKLLSKQKQKEMLAKRDLYEDSELYWIFISFIIPEKFMRKLFFKFGPPPSKKGEGTIDEWVYWQDVSESFIREFKDYISFETISTKIKIIDKNYLREYKEKLDWRYITNKFEWDKQSVKEFKKYIDIKMLKFKNRDLYEEVFE